MCVPVKHDGIGIPASFVCVCVCVCVCAGG